METTKTCLNLLPSYLCCYSIQVDKNNSIVIKAQIANDSFASLESVGEEHIDARPFVSSILIPSGITLNLTPENDPSLIAKDGSFYDSLITLESVATADAIVIFNDESKFTGMRILPHKSIRDTVVVGSHRYMKNPETRQAITIAFSLEIIDQKNPSAFLLKEVKDIEGKLKTDVPVSSDDEQNWMIPVEEELDFGPKFR